MNKKIITDDNMLENRLTNMSYAIEITAKVRKVIDKRCDNHIKKRLFTKLLKLENDPKSCGKPLRTPLAGTWQLNFEKRWRILFEIDENNKLITITGFKHKDEMAQERL